MIMCMTALNVYRPYMLESCWKHCCNIRSMTSCHVKKKKKAFLIDCFPVRCCGNLPHRRTDVVLGDPNGKAWVVVYIPSSRGILSGGWSAFAHVNNLEEGDYCVFELVGPVEMCVHIFRVVGRSLL